MIAEIAMSAALTMASPEVDEVKIRTAIQRDSWALILPSGAVTPRVARFSVFGGPNEVEREGRQKCYFDKTKLVRDLRGWYCALPVPEIRVERNLRLVKDWKKTVAAWGHVKIVAANPKTRKACLLSLEDWGPSKSTWEGRTYKNGDGRAVPFEVGLDCSPAAQEHLGCQTGDPVIYGLAEDQSAPLGPCDYPETDGSKSLRVLIRLYRAAVTHCGECPACYCVGMEHQCQHREARSKNGVPRLVEDYVRQRRIPAWCPLPEWRES